MAMVIAGAEVNHASCVSTLGSGKARAGLAVCGGRAPGRRREPADTKQPRRAAVRP